MHISQLHKEVERGEFSLKFVRENGEIVSAPRCICTSFHSKGATLNIKLCESEEIRKVNRITIIEVNGREVYL